MSVAAAAAAAAVVTESVELAMVDYTPAECSDATEVCSDWLFVSVYQLSTC